MSDLLVLAARLVALLLVPALLSFPIVVTLFTPLRAKSDTERTAARLRLGVLLLATVLAFALWGALLFAAVRFQHGLVATLAQFAWVLFFPLWFMFAMPAIRARNPVWSGALGGSFAADTPVRTAVLQNRARQNPITRTLWVIAACVSIGLLIATAARGLRPFEDGGFAGSGDIERQRWLAALGLQAICVLLTAGLLPLSIGKLHAEPEPLDARGSPELVELYRVQRRRRARGLFWLLAVILPGFLGAMICAGVWLPGGSGSAIALVGGLGGSAIGMAGAVFGCTMALQRVRIAEAKARLDGEGRTA